MNIRTLAIPAVIALSGSLLVGCGDTTEEPSPSPTDAMTEEDSMTEDDA